MQEERLKPKSERNEHKAAKGEKVVKKRREDWSTGIPREQGSDHPVCSRFPSHPKQRLALDVPYGRAMAFGKALLCAL